MEHRQTGLGILMGALAPLLAGGTAMAFQAPATVEKIDLEPRCHRGLRPRRPGHGAVGQPQGPPVGRGGPAAGGGLIRERKDSSPGDGIHPSPSGWQKVARMLPKFVTEDPLAARWFVKDKAS